MRARAVQMLSESSPVIRGVTKSRTAGAMTKDIEEYICGLLNHSFCAVALINADGTVRYQNPSAERISGYKENEIIGKGLHEFIHPEDVPYVLGAIQSLANKPGQSISLNARFMRRDCSWRALEAIATNLLNNPIVNAIVFNYQDTTDQELMEKAIRELYKNYHLLADNVTDIIFFLDMNLNIIYVSPSNARLHGYTPEELKEKDAMTDLVSTATMKDIADLYHEVFTLLTSGDGEQTWSKTVELELKHKDGYNIWIEVTATMVHDPENKQPGFVGVARDITERKQAETERLRLNAELGEKNKELEQIVYVASHDLRSPLVNVQGFSKELRYSLREIASNLQGEDIPSDVQRKISNILESDITDALRYIEASVSKMDSLLAGLLRLSRLGRVALKFEQLDMNHLIEEIVEAFEYAIKGAGANVKVSNLPPCVGDHVQINQLFSNLLDNALKYRDPERPAVIEITGQQVNDQVVYCVRDNGIGIPKEHYSKIFEIFQRLNPGTTSGEGLGLSIVKKILSRHNGSISVESEAGVGSRFSVSLPSASKH
jgi:PAS domain S-box-containing protein